MASVQVEKKCFMGDFLHLLWKPAAGLAESAMRQKRTEDGRFVLKRESFLQVALENKKVVEI